MHSLVTSHAGETWGSSIATSAKSRTGGTWLVDQILRSRRGEGYVDWGEAIVGVSEAELGCGRFSLPQSAPPPP